MKSTPGPWEIGLRKNKYCVDTDNPGEQQALLVLGKDKFEALSVGTDKNQVAIIPLDESNKANAKLIASAPELLEACKEFVRKVDCGQARSIKSYAQMKQAIAKAEGKQ